MTGRWSQSPDDRSCQKTVYFLQVFGFYLGYRFSWYLYGPYSPALTKDGFELRGFIDKMSEAGFPETEPEQKFQEFLRFIQPFKDNPRELELLASLHFLHTLEPKPTRQQIIERVKAKQWYFSSAKAEAAWTYLRKFNLVGPAQEV